MGFRKTNVRTDEPWSWRKKEVDKMPKISVIIPVYNTEQYLRGCLESVLHQTLQDVEVLCTDDGSTDASLAILQEYAAMDERVCIFQQENQGAGPARNMGLANAKGEYVVFMDWDDVYPTDDTLEKMYAAAKEHRCQVVAGYRSLLTEEGQCDDKNDPLYRMVQQYPQGKMTNYAANWRAKRERRICFKELRKS